MKRFLPFALFGIAILVPQSARACTIPVFRYALEKWDLTPAELLVFHNGALPKELDETLTQFGAAPHKLNLEITRADLASKVAPKLMKLWEREGKKDQGPWMLIRYAGMDPTDPSAYSGPCTVANLKSIADSPLRQAILAHLARGTAVVWVQVTSEDRQADETIHALLKKELAGLEKKIKLPVQSDTGPKIMLPLPLKASFTLLVLDRNKPEEAGFLQLLLGMEDRLQTMKGPMVFPVFGRGRVLGSLCAAKKEITEEQILEVTKFLCRECSCQIKDLNPGIDAVMSADWRKMFDRLYDKKDAMEMPKDMPTTLPALPKKSSAAPGEPSRIGEPSRVSGRVAVRATWRAATRAG